MIFRDNTFEEKGAGILDLALSAALVLLFSLQAAASPALPLPISWSGTQELWSGKPDLAFEAVSKDSLDADTVLHLYKLGSIGVELKKEKETLDALNKVVSSCKVLAPLAYEKIGDLYCELEDGGKALAGYGSALNYSLPRKYRYHLFEKIRTVVDSGARIQPGTEWLREYSSWAAKDHGVDVSALQKKLGSFLDAGSVKRADSLLERSLSGLTGWDAGTVIGVYLKKRNFDSTSSADFLFSLAQKCYETGNFALTDNLLTSTKNCKDFSSSVSPKEFLLYSARIAYKRGRYKQAVDLYKKYHKKHGASSEVFMQIARSYRKLKHSGDAAKWYDLHIKYYPSHSKSVEILWLRAWQHEARKHFKSAASVYRQIYGTDNKRASEARLRHALCYYRRGEYERALANLRAFQKNCPQAYHMLAGIYWQGKCLKALGREKEARKVWEKLVGLDPTDYYAHRARQMLGDSVRAVTALFGPDSTDVQTSRMWLDSISPSKKNLSSQDSIYLRRGAALLSVGESKTADFFLENFEKNYPYNLMLQFDLVSAYTLSGDPALAHRVGRRLSWRIPLQHRADMPLPVRSVLYPAYFSEAITENARKFGVDPLLVSAVIRQESIFDPEIVSPAGAVGLMQIMPYTGEAIAKKLNEAFSVDSLYNFAYNARFGTFYLRELMDRWKDNTVLVLASYNAGPHNAQKWYNRGKDLEYDLFVEDIGFTETRGYVKKVMGNYWTYQALSKVPQYAYFTLVSEEVGEKKNAATRP
ncbi:MAG: transglycosylase SLT domain-containing protein [Chitinispirillaceae bacterium]